MSKIICLFGDSITWGEGDSEKGGWGARLRSYFETNNFKIELYNCGVSGDNTDKLLQRFTVETSAREPDIVIFAIGVNDSQYVRSKDNPRVSLEKFQNNLQELINQAKKFTEQIIFIGLIHVDESKTMPVPWITTLFYDEENVKLYDEKIKEICDRNSLRFIEMLDLLNNSDLKDGLHPNAQGHEKIFFKIRDSLASISR